MSRSSGLRRTVTALALAWLGCLLSLPSLASDHALDEWQAQARQVRQLAENDAPRAYQQALALQAKLPPGATPVVRTQALNLLSRVESYMALTEPAARHANEAYQLALRHGDRVGQAEADLNVALTSVNQGKLDELVTVTQRSVVTLKGVDRPELLSEALLRAAAMYRRFEQFERSAAVAVQAMEIARRANHPLALAYAHQGMAITFDQSNRVPESLQHYQQMRIQAQAVPSRLMEAFAVAGLAGTTLRSGDTQAAEALGREAVAIYREVGAPFSISFGLHGLAENLRAQKRYPDALALLNEALTIYERHPNRIGKWFVLNARSRTLQALGRDAAALADAEQSQALAQELGRAVYLKGSAARLADLAAARGDFRRAYQFEREASRMGTQAAHDGADERMVQLIQQYETEGRQRAIDELTRRNEQQTAQLRQRELQQRWLWTLILASMLVLIGASLFVHRLRRSNDAMTALNQQLRASENHIRSLNASLELRVLDRTVELRQRMHYLRTLVDVLPMWVWLKDTDSRYLVVNQAHATARGHAVSDMEGGLDQQLLPTELAQRQLAEDQLVMSTQQRQSTEERVVSDGGEVWMETYKAAVLDDDGAVLGTVGVSFNISERKAAEAAREASLTEARRLATQRSSFLAQMSHELRTPLNGILGFAQILQRDDPLTERQTRGLKIIEESGQHLLALINDILDLASVDAAKLALHVTTLRLPVFLQVVCDIIRVKAEEKDLLLVDPAIGLLPWTVRTDEKRLRQILLNLLSNAVKFTDSGRVILRVTRVEASDNTWGSALPLRLRFEVEDEGIGMSEAQLARLFRPFEQVSESARRVGGTGLGLAISHALVRLMGGQLQVRSELGVGSCFSFEIELPMVMDQAPDVSLPGPPVAYAGPRRSVLVVDDLPQVRLLLVDVLSGLGFTVLQAADGHEALAAVAATLPDLILMDMMMPGMNGFDAIQRLRQQASTARVPILAMSASASPHSEESCREAGANAFISKPIDHHRLFQLMADLLALTWITGQRATPPLAEA